MHYPRWGSIALIFMSFLAVLFLLYIVGVYRSSHVFAFLASGMIVSLLVNITIAIFLRKTDNYRYETLQRLAILSLCSLELGLLIFEAVHATTNVTAVCAPFVGIRANLLVFCVTLGPTALRMSVPTAVCISASSFFTAALAMALTSTTDSASGGAATLPLLSLLIGCSVGGCALTYAARRSQRQLFFLETCEGATHALASGTIRDMRQQLERERQISLDNPAAEMISIVRKVMVRYHTFLTPRDSQRLEQCCKNLATFGKDMFLPQLSRQLARAGMDEDAKSWVHLVSSREEHREDMNHPSIRETKLSRSDSSSARQRCRSLNPPDSIREEGIPGLGLNRQLSNSVSMPAANLPGTVCEEGPDTAAVLRNLLDHWPWSWNIFAFAEMTEHPLALLFTAFLHDHNISRTYPVPREVIMPCARALDAAYLNKPYHNNIHATSVLYDVNWLLLKGNLVHVISDLDVFAALFAAAIHDIAHPAVDNPYHVLTRSELAMTYSDDSVNERFHLSTGFRIATDGRHNLFRGLSAKDYDHLRSVVIEMVLATDLSNHFEDLGALKAIELAQATDDMMAGTTTPLAGLASPAAVAPSYGSSSVVFAAGGGGGGSPAGHSSTDAGAGSRGSRLPAAALTMEDVFGGAIGLCLRLTIKLADIGHVSKSRDLHLRWTDKVNEEFFAQGDALAERALPVEAMHDRAIMASPGRLARSQMGFFNFIVKPLYSAMEPYVSHSSEFAHGLHDNFMYWKSNAPRAPGAAAAAGDKQKAKQLAPLI